MPQPLQKRRHCWLAHLTPAGSPSTITPTSASMSSAVRARARQCELCSCCLERCAAARAPQLGQAVACQQLRAEAAGVGPFLRGPCACQPPARATRERLAAAWPVCEPATLHRRTDALMQALIRVRIAAIADGRGESPCGAVLARMPAVQDARGLNFMRSRFGTGRQLSLNCDLRIRPPSLVPPALGLLGRSACSPPGRVKLRVHGPTRYR